MYPLPPNLYVEILSSNVMVLGGRIIEKLLGNEEGTLKIGINSFKGEIPESPLALFLSCEDTKRSPLPATQKRALTGTDHPGNLISDFQPPGL